MKTLPFIVVTLALCTVLFSCKKKKNSETDSDTPTATTGPSLSNIYGYGILAKLPGIWNGPITSTTVLGGYPEWIVDLRPVSENQVSSKNELDTLNDIFMSFFVALHNNEYRIAFRNGGSFSGSKRVSYFLADSVVESSSKSYYRFSEIVLGKKRAYTEVIFINDSLYIKSYTNKYNTLASATLHMTWSAKLQDTTSAQNAVAYFNFPKKSMTKDFTTTFAAAAEAVFYDLASDPYPDSAQPYVGTSNISYSFAPGYTPVSTNKVFLLITTQPLFTGMVFNAANLKYRSRYVILSAADYNFAFTNMHPGTYYLYAFYDNDGNNTVNSGDWFSALNTSFTLTSAGTTSASTQINFTIP